MSTQQNHWQHQLLDVTYVDTSHIKWYFMQHNQHNRWFLLCFWNFMQQPYLYCSESYLQPLLHNKQYSVRITRFCIAHFVNLFTFIAPHIFDTVTECIHMACQALNLIMYIIFVVTICKNFVFPHTICYLCYVNKSLPYKSTLNPADAGTNI
jgi:hypothetical protein